MFIASILSHVAVAAAAVVASNVFVYLFLRANKKKAAALAAEVNKAATKL